MLRVAAGAPGVTTTALSQALHLARPTVSNLFNTMRREKLVELRRRTDDARVVEVNLSARARGLLQRYDARSTALMQKALEQLDVDQRAALAAASPALSQLRKLLGGQRR